MDRGAGEWGKGKMTTFFSLSLSVSPHAELFNFKFLAVVCGALKLEKSSRLYVSRAS